MAQAASRFEVGLLYAAAALQGLALVSFPAASAILVSPDGFALSGTQYGAMFVLLCIATGAVGLGFGATVMALNTFVEGYFPARADAAVLSLNALVGLGNALAPVLSAAFSRLGAWWALP